MVGTLPKFSSTLSLKNLSKQIPITTLVKRFPSQEKLYVVSSVFYFFHFVNKQKIMYIFEEQNTVTTLFLFIQKIFNFRAV